MRFKAVEFTNFKGLEHYRVPLEDVTVLVGSNNCGKSTIISAFRALEVGLRAARSRTAQRFDLGDSSVVGYLLSPDALPISLENVHTDYRDADSRILFRLEDQNSLELLFPKDGGCY